MTDPSNHLRNVLRGLFQLRPAPPHSWLTALRGSLCMGVPILAGWLAGDTAAGLMAGIGGFTGMYGSGRPYVSRARLLALIAVGLAIAISVGLWVGGIAWAVIVSVALTAMLATWLSNALQIGPPGAFMFVLAIAAGTAIPASHLNWQHAGLLVLAGGAFSWIVHLGGALIWPRGPERAAVTAAGHAVTAYIGAAGSSESVPARRQAAFALHEAWATLVSRQPVSARPDGTLARLRALNRELHLCFADALSMETRQQPMPVALLENARRLSQQAQQAELAPATNANAGRVPLGHPGAWAAALDALRPGAQSRRVILRVGLAAVLAGSVGAMFHLDHAYWAVAAAVLMLHQGLNWLLTIQRSIERTVGTWVGLLLAAVVVMLQPRGAWLALTVAALQFATQMLVRRNYALAVVFITGLALTIASGGHALADPGSYLLARGVDTLAGCAVALLVYRLVPPRAAQAQIPDQLVTSLRAVAATLVHIADGNVTSLPAKAARQHLLRSTFALTEAYDQCVAASRRQRRSADRAWPVIAATERLAYRTLSVCWALERLGNEAAAQSALSMLGTDGAARLQQALAMLITAVQASDTTPNLPPLPVVLDAELRHLHECLTGIPPAADGRDGA